MIKHFALVLFTACVMIGCTPEPEAQHPAVQVDCVGACAQAEALHCSIAGPNRHCIEACRNADDNGFPWNAGCMTAATTCDLLENCE